MRWRKHHGNFACFSFKSKIMSVSTELMINKFCMDLMREIYDMEIYQHQFWYALVPLWSDISFLIIFNIFFPGWRWETKTIFLSYSCSPAKFMHTSQIFISFAIFHLLPKIVSFLHDFVIVVILQALVVRRSSLERTIPHIQQNIEIKMENVFVFLKNEALYGERHENICESQEHERVWQKRETLCRHILSYRSEFLRASTDSLFEHLWSSSFNTFEE